MCARCSRALLPYTWGLLSSVPRLTGDVSVPLVPVRGAPPSVINLPPGCPFKPRCDLAALVPGDRCRTDRPQLRLAASGSRVACHLQDQTRGRIVEQVLLPLWEKQV